MSAHGRDGPSLPGQIAGWLLIAVLLYGFAAWMSFLAGLLVAPP